MLALDPAAQAAASTQISTDDSTALRHVVLVAGYDYERTGTPLLQARSSFRFLCNNRVKRYLAKNPSIKTDENWKFTIFDVRSGKVLLSSYDSQTQARSWTELLSFTAVTEANYSVKAVANPQFDSQPFDTLSITDVYDYVCAIGVNNPGSLWELSFFTHGWMGGPILVNFFEPNKARTDRDPDDKDARLLADFTSAVMNVADFRNAFHPSGFIWTWGCAFTLAYRHTLQKLITKSNYSLSLIADSETFSLSYTSFEASKYFAAIPSFFPSSFSTTSSTVVTKTFAELKKFFRTGLLNTYCHAIARAAARPCYGAALGTYADFGREPDQLMRIPNDITKYGGFDFTPQLKFYTTHLGAQIDPEGRGYIKHPL